jgi:glucose/mannose-6-phosphate isomerase
MVGFTDPRAKFSFIFLQDPADNPRVKKRMAIMKGLMEKNSLPVFEVKMAGSSPLEKMFSTLLLGDWVSYYAALENGTDPAPVKMVEDFKKKMG